MAEMALRAYKVLESQSSNNNLTRAETQRDDYRATFMGNYVDAKKADFSVQIFAGFSVFARPHNFSKKVARLSWR